MRRFYDFKTYSASENPMQHPIQIRTYAIRWRSAFALERFVDVRTVAAELGGTSKIMLPCHASPYMSCRVPSFSLDGISGSIRRPACLLLTDYDPLVVNVDCNAHLFVPFLDRG